MDSEIGSCGIILIVIVIVILAMPGHHPHIFCVYVSKIVNEVGILRKSRVFIDEIAKTGVETGEGISREVREDREGIFYHEIHEPHERYLFGQDEQDGQDVLWSPRCG